MTTALKIEDSIALDEQIEANAKALRAKLDQQADLPEVEAIIATLDELLQSRETTKAI